MDTHYRSIVVLLAALALAILGDILLRGIPWGANIPLLIVVSLSVMLLLSRWGGAPPVRGSWAYAAVAVLLSFCFVLRDSPVLLLLDAAGILASLAFVYARTARADLWAARILEYVHALFMASIHSVVGFLFLLFKDIPWKSLKPQPPDRRSLPVLRGALLASPVLFVLAGLYMSADAVFDRLVRTVIDVDLETIVVHGMTILFLTYVVGGFLRGGLLSTEFVLPSVGLRPRFSLGRTELTMLLGGVNVLSFLFVAIQVRYLFGGASLVEVTPGLTYAAYARQGFFELVSSAALSIGVMLLAGWLANRETEGVFRRFQVLAVIQSLLLFAIMASATRRLALYQTEFGLTEARIYAAACMGWLALTLVWFQGTVVRGREERFAGGAVLAGFVVLLALNALNPEGLIADTNVRRASEGEACDAHYLARLSDDAVPVLLGALSQLAPEQRSPIALRILQRHMENRSADLRSWNISRRRARMLVEEHQAELRRYALMPAPGSR
jgi:hypothetical protein